MNSTWRVALAQINCYEGDKEKNLQNIEKSIVQAYKEQADLLVLPEMILTGFLKKQELLQLAETRDGESMKRIQKILNTYPLHLVYSFPEYGGENIIYNTTSFIHKNGTPLGYYRKIHLFDTERLIIDRGNEFVEVSVDGIKVGLLTCYDIEFPESARNLALRGAQLIVSPTANMIPYEDRHKLFIRSRAIENHVFVAYCNRIGSNRLYKYHGDSSVVGPEGNLIMEITGDKEDLQVCEINFDDIEKSKSLFNYIEERRSELYS